MSTGLYIHVPFCIRKCPYCDFYSVSFRDELYDDYVAAVLRNIEGYISDYPDLMFDTVYFGGGTPSLMPAEFFDSVINAVKNNLSADHEITMELNPKTADPYKLKQIREAGVDRISVGIQSAIESELLDLGRIHTFEDASNAVCDARNAGFDNISADLMIGIKGQDADSLKFSINELAKLGVDHISSYMLKIEPGTEYFAKGIGNEVPDEDETADMYLFSVKELESRGYIQYEISNFSHPGYESRHNLKYWRCEEYIGIGPSSHSYFNNKRYEVPRDLTEFIRTSRQCEIINEDEPGDFFEKAMLALRLTEGLDLSKYHDEAPYVIKRAEKYIKAGLVKHKNNIIRFTPEGFVVSNFLISELLADF